MHIYIINTDIIFIMQAIEPDLGLYYVDYRKGFVLHCSYYYIISISTSPGIGKTAY